ncbi:ribosome biogenesis factor YjgA [Methylotuvimicrobium sp. KM1]|uniref:ribosome biogenesis factor YjgA n=1 Tax=Methylotuvimicrobium sp. KM1 TaxID=3377707 RepID=UPI00385113EF
MIEEYQEYEEFDDEVEYYAVRPNKTQIKRDIAVLFELGEELVALSAAQLSTLDLPEGLHKAVIGATGMPPKGARKRQMKFICGLLRKLDVDPITEKLARIKNQSAHATREHHKIERWRDRLISEGQDALTELIDEYPQTDRQLLRQLMRSAQKEAAEARPPKSSRELYRYLKELFEADSD